MLWLVSLSLAIGFWKMGSYLRNLEEVYSLAAKIASFIVLLWSFTIAPPIAQIIILLLLLGWNFMFASPVMHYRHK
ncbi:MAG: hypothetical protein SWY16_24025 [Cyanobacteriota bacterium]|nr:hypothetical protein [Cyanobacteriota bacterium]